MGLISWLLSWTVVAIGQAFSQLFVVKKLGKGKNGNFSIHVTVRWDFVWVFIWVALSFCILQNDWIWQGCLYLTPLSLNKISNWECQGSIQKSRWNEWMNEWMFIILFCTCTIINENKRISEWECKCKCQWMNACMYVHYLSISQTSSLCFMPQIVSQVD